jgi:hypothetical protein
MPGQEEIMLGPEEIIVIVSAILGLIVLIASFVISSRLIRMVRVLEFFQRLENRKPENWTQIKCKKCHFEFRASKGSKSKVSCPKCKTFNSLTIN